MTRAGVDPRLIVNYVNNSGMAQPVSAQDVIYLTQQGVPPDVIQAMQTPRVAQVPARVVAPPPGPVIIEEYHYGRRTALRRITTTTTIIATGPRVGWGISFSG